MRCRALRGMPYLRPQIQAQIRLKRPHRRLREENESDDTEEGLRLKTALIRQRRGRTRAKIMINKLYRADRGID